MSKGTDRIELAGEIEMIEAYLRLQQLHYGEKIDWQFEIEEDVRHFLIPKFILQPVVENAILHGIAK